MATSRFAHYLKVMARDWIGSFMEAEDCQKKLQRWISNYVNANEGASAEAKAQYPLREAEVRVERFSRPIRVWAFRLGLLSLLAGGAVLFWAYREYRIPADAYVYSQQQQRR